MAEWSNTRVTRAAVSSSVCLFDAGLSNSIKDMAKHWQNLLEILNLNMSSWEIMTNYLYGHVNKTAESSKVKKKENHEFQIRSFFTCVIHAGNSRRLSPSCSSWSRWFEWEMGVGARTLLDDSPSPACVYMCHYFGIGPHLQKLPALPKFESHITNENLCFLFAAFPR